MANCIRVFRRAAVLPSCDAAAAVTAAAAAGEVAGVLSGDGLRRESRAFRVVLALHDVLSAASDDLLGALVLDPPPSTGDRRFDALIAGLADFHVSRRSLPVPPWVLEPHRVADPPWDVSGVAVAEDLVPQLARRGVRLSRLELSSV